jgi:hypothetical protein
MSYTLFAALAALLPASVLFCGSAILFRRSKTIWSSLQVSGAAGLIVVVLAHMCEAMGLFPWMGWALQHSPGHYVDLTGALIEVTMFPTGYLFHALRGLRGMGRPQLAGTAASEKLTIHRPG